MIQSKQEMLWRIENTDRSGNRHGPHTGQFRYQRNYQGLSRCLF